jgi:hypothetical protein
MKGPLIPMPKLSGKPLWETKGQEWCHSRTLYNLIKKALSPTPAWSKKLWLRRCPQCLRNVHCDRPSRLVFKEWLAYWVARYTPRQKWQIVSLDSKIVRDRQCFCRVLASGHWWHCFQWLRTQELACSLSIRWFSFQNNPQWCVNT